MSAQTRRPNLVGATYNQQRFFKAQYSMEEAERSMRPRFPKGTPEYESYADRLRVELAKFVAGNPPYNADRRL